MATGAACAARHGARPGATRNPASRTVERVRKVLAVVVVLVVLVGVAAVADAVLRDRAEERIAGEVADAIPGVSAPPDVTIEGYPFVTQLAAGSLDAVRLTAREAVVDGLRLEDVVVRAHGVSTTAPHTVERAEMRAVVRPEDVAAVLGLDGLALGIDDGELQATADVLGVPLDVGLAVRPEGRDVVVDVVAFELGGFRVDSDALPAELTAQLTGLRFTVTGLPEGMTLTALTVDDDGLRLAAEGRALALDAA